MRPFILLAAVCLAAASPFSDWHSSMQRPSVKAEPIKYGQTDSTLPKDGEAKQRTFELPAQGGPVFLDWKVTYTAKGEEMASQGWCGPVCRIKRHEGHHACDVLCDNPCPNPGDHVASFLKEGKDLGNGDAPPAEPHADRLAKDFEQLGVTDAKRRAEHVAMFPLAGFSDYPGFSAKFPHLLALRCAKVPIYFPTKTFIATAEYQLYRTVNGQRVNGPKGTLRFLAFFPVAGNISFGDPEVDCLCEASAPPPPPPPQMPQDGQSVIQRIQLNGPLWMECTYIFKEEGERDIYLGTCKWICQGRKHPKHAQCDKSCDAPCQPIPGGKKLPHWYVVAKYDSELAENEKGEPEEDHQTKLERELKEFGFDGGGADLFAGQPFVFPNVKATLPKAFEVELDHWNKEACSESLLFIKGKKYIVTVEYRFVDYTNRPVGDPRTSAGSRVKYQLILPVPGSQPFADEPVVNCRCEGTQTVPPVPQEDPPPPTPPGHGMGPGRPRTGGTEYAWIEQNGMRRPLTSSEAARLVSGISVPNMNEAFFTMAAVALGTRIFIPAGWELQCLTAAAQDVQLQEDLMYELVEGDSLLASVFPMPGVSQQKRVRTLCLEIGKPEPSEGMKYRLVPPRFASLTRLAQITRSSRFKGPWDQMRLWIATDHASLDQIAKVLIPTPGPGTYVRQLWLAWQAGTIDPRLPSAARLFEPRLMVAENYDKEAISWFIEEKLRMDAAGTSRWIRSQGSDIAALFGKGDPKEDVELLGILASGFARHGGWEGVSAAIWLVSEAAPPAHRAAVASTAGARDLAYELTRTSESSTAMLLLDWFEKAKPSGWRAACLNASPDLPAAIHARAKALSGELE